MEEKEAKFSKLLAPSRHEILVRVLNLHNQLLMAQSTTMNTVNIPNDQMIQSDQEPGAMMIEEEKKQTNDVYFRKRQHEDIKREAVQKA